MRVITRLAIFLINSVAFAQQLVVPINPYSVTGYQFAEETVSRRHLGEDVHAIEGVGTPVRAIADGEIILSRNTRPGYGQYIAIAHSNPTPYISFYGHLSRQTLYPMRGLGTVNKGDIIGYIGSHDENGGYDPHLHFALYKAAPDGVYHYWGYAPNDSLDDVDIDIAGNSIGGLFTKPSIFIQNHSSTNPLYSVTDLGVLPGGSWSQAFAINNVGTIVGYSDGTFNADYNLCGGGTTTSKPFIWTAAGGIQELGHSPMLDSYSNPIGSCGGMGFGINDQGMVVGLLDYGFNGGFRSFIWTAANGMQLIRDQNGYVLGPGGAYAVNNAGQVVGGGGGSLAYQWTETGGLKHLESPGWISSARAINNSGESAGYMQWAASYPVYWNSAGKLQYMDGLPYNYNNYATGINDSGQVVGTTTGESSSSIFPDNRSYGFIWSPSTSALDLGDLPGNINGSPSTVANGINNSGKVVGVSNNRAFLWTQETGIQDLNSLLDQSGTGWTLYSANAINAAGQIVGYGDHNGAFHAFLLSNQQVNTTTFTFTGAVTSVTDPNGIMGNTVIVGTSVSGMFRYELSAVNELSGNPNIGRYRYASGVSKLSVTIDTQTGQKTIETSLPGDQFPGAGFGVEVDNDFLIGTGQLVDRLRINAGGSKATWKLPLPASELVRVLLIKIDLSDSFPPLAFLNNTELPTSLDFSQTQDSYLDSTFSGNSSIGVGAVNGGYSINFRLTSLTKVAVP